MLELELLSIRIFLVKVTLKIGQEKDFFWFCFWRLGKVRGYKLKDLNGEKIIRSFYEKVSLLSINEYNFLL